MNYFSEEIETMDWNQQDALVDERIRYAVQYAAENAPPCRMVL